MRIVNFWSRCPLQRPPFVHPEDEPAFRACERSELDLPALDFAGFIASQWFCDVRDKQFHLSLVPLPYDGDLRHADIFVLTLNPGLKASDYYAESRVRPFRERRKATLRQQLDGIDYPFMGLDPAFSWHSGFRYWEGKFRDVASTIAKARHGYQRALEELANRVAVLQLVPYHSASFNRRALLAELASTREAQRFARDVLAPRAAAGKVLMVVVRGGAHWDIKPGRNAIVYDGALTRGASLGSGTQGGEAILNWMRKRGPQGAL